MRNGDFSAAMSTGQPKEWWVWQRESSQGHFAQDPTLGVKAKGSGHVSQAADGCFGQNVKVLAGASYAVTGWVRRGGQGFAGIAIRWKDVQGRWTAEGRDFLLKPAGLADSQGWREHVGLVRIPESAAEMVVLLVARRHKGALDQAWFDDVQVVRIQR